jgi:hypothetical protein
MNEAKKYHEIEVSHTKEKQATLQYKEKYAAAAKKYAKHLSKQAQQAAAKAAHAAKEEQAAKKSLEAGKSCKGLTSIIRLIQLVGFSSLTCIQTVTKSFS